MRTVWGLSGAQSCARAFRHAVPSVLLTTQLAPSQLVKYHLLQEAFPDFSGSSITFGFPSPIIHVFGPKLINI